MASRSVGRDQIVSSITHILTAVEQGDRRAADELLPLVYEELRKLAASRLAKEPPGQTLQATALVHEAYLRLVGSEPIQWDNRGHFFGAAAEAMRRIMGERARRKQRVRHGGEHRRMDVEEAELVGSVPSDDLLALDEALDRLAAENPKMAELVKLRSFAGLSHQEAASALGISRATADRHWSYARAWLYRQVRKGAGGKAPDSHEES